MGVASSSHSRRCRHNQLVAAGVPWQGVGRGWARRVSRPSAPCLNFWTASRGILTAGGKDLYGYCTVRTFLTGWRDSESLPRQVRGSQRDPRAVRPRMATRRWADRRPPRAGMMDDWAVLAMSVCLAEGGDARWGKRRGRPPGNCGRGKTYRPVRQWARPIWRRPPRAYSSRRRPLPFPFA